MSRCEELKDLHISGMGGIETWQDALEFLLLGAGSLQVTTAVMQYGYRIISDLTEGLAEYMKCKNVTSLSSLIGAASTTVVDHQAIKFDAEKRRPKLIGKLCVGCHLCIQVCLANAVGTAGKSVDRRIE